MERFPGSKGMRDVADGIQVDVVLAGDYPGDGKPKPIAFPDPAHVETLALDGVPVVPLWLLLELKIASGITAPHRAQDIADAIQLIKRNRLPRDFEIDPYVRAKFEELWGLAQVDDDA